MNKHIEPTDLVALANGTELQPESIARAGEECLDAEDESEWCWVIPHQPKIQVTATANGVRLWQEGRHGDDDNQEIEVAKGNSISLAKMILWAAGWKSIGIYSYEKGGCFDLEDGMLAESVAQAGREQ